MSTTPKWYCRNKSQPMHTFAEIGKLGLELRRITKRIVIDVNSAIFSEHDTILEECERVVEQYWNLKDETKNADFQSLSKKIKRSPYNQLLMKKFHLIMDLNDRRFCQLTFVLKRTLSFLLRKAMQSEMWLNWALHITQLYNKCRKLEKPLVPVEVDKPPGDEELDEEPKLSGKRKEEMPACVQQYVSCSAPGAQIH
ncbi:GM23626 [Drosophila sechellia]|uniref:GM23626 n=1 Tax=Drosophila sechellia TaxID=7238 RepID=B4HES5_DROSE|nr:GM23626 [Drosophila sechellia]